MSKIPDEKKSTPDTDDHETIKIRDRDGQIITIPKPKNIFKEAFEQGIDLREAAGMEE